jgi:hypothetical protein
MISARQSVVFLIEAASISVGNLFFAADDAAVSHDTVVPFSLFFLLNNIISNQV